MEGSFASERGEGVARHAGMRSGTRLGMRHAGTRLGARLTSGRSMSACMRSLPRMLATAALAFSLLAAPAVPAWADTANQVDPQLVPDSSFIYDTPIVDLSQADSYYDGQTVRVTGEVVGDRIVAGAADGHCWITLTDPAFDINNTVEIYMTTEQASRIDAYGRYGQIGTIISVQGTFNLVCAEHQGESDVHADTVTVSQRGRSIPDEYSPEALLPGAVAIAIGLAMMLVVWRLQERRR